MVIKLVYTQTFAGAVISDSYERTVKDENEAAECVSRLYEDPNVNYAKYVVLKA